MSMGHTLRRLNEERGQAGKSNRRSIFVRIPNIFIDIPHHLTQRGNYRQSVFCTDDDYLSYLELLWQYSLLYRVKIWA